MEGLRLYGTLEKYRKVGLDKQLLPVFSWFRIIYQLFEFGEKERDTYNTPERDLMIAS